MDKRAKKLAVGTLIAGVAGYLAGILTAPKSGKETRQDIHDAALKAKTEAEKNLKAAHSELSAIITDGKAQAAKAKDTVNKELTAALEKAEVAKQKAKQLLSAVRDGEVDDRDLKKAIDDAKKAIDHLSKYVKKNA